MFATTLQRGVAAGILVLISAVVSSYDIPEVAADEPAFDVEKAQLSLQPVVDDVVAHSSEDSAYSGVAVAVVENEILVYRVPGIDDPFGSSYDELVDGRANLVIEDALLTEQQNSVLLEKVNDSAAALLEQGITLSFWGPSEQGGPFHIGTGNLEADNPVLLEMFTEFGPSTLTISQSAGFLVPAVGRLDDQQPFKGGARLTLPAGQKASVQAGLVLMQLQTLVIIFSRRCIAPMRKILESGQGFQRTSVRRRVVGRPHLTPRSSRLKPELLRRLISYIPALFPALAQRNK